MYAFNKTITIEELKASKADEIILATGSNPKMLKIPGAEMLAAEDVLTEKADAGKSTIIIGGGLVGCETALWLKKDRNVDVTIVELMQDILSVGGPLCSANKDMLQDLLKFHKIDILTGNSDGKDGRRLPVKTSDGEKTISADTVICAVGYAPERGIYEEIKASMPYVHLLGDAEQVSNIMYAHGMRMNWPEIYR